MKSQGLRSWWWCCFWSWPSFLESLSRGHHPVSAQWRNATLNSYILSNHIQGFSYALPKSLTKLFKTSAFSKTVGCVSLLWYVIASYRHKVMNKPSTAMTLHGLFSHSGFLLIAISTTESSNRKAVSHTLHWLAIRSNTSSKKGNLTRNRTLLQL